MARSPTSTASTCAQQVTTFTASDFSRTFTTNGDGTDHAWGSHQFVMGGAVKAADVYGQFPTVGVDVGDGFQNPEHVRQRSHSADVRRPVRRHDGQDGSASTTRRSHRIFPNIPEFYQSLFRLPRRAGSVARQRTESFSRARYSTPSSENERRPRLSCFSPAPAAARSAFQVSAGPFPWAGGARVRDTYQREDAPLTPVEHHLADAALAAAARQLHHHIDHRLRIVDHVGPRQR